MLLCTVSDIAHKYSTIFHFHIPATTKMNEEPYSPTSTGGRARVSRVIEQRDSTLCNEGDLNVEHVAT